MKSFAKESAAFAKALQAEHLELGKLLLVLQENHAKVVTTRLEEFSAAKVAHDGVEYQRARTEAARGA